MYSQSFAFFAEQIACTPLKLHCRVMYYNGDQLVLVEVLPTAVNTDTLIQADSIGSFKVEVWKLFIGLNGGGGMYTCGKVLYSDQWVKVML